LDNSDNVVQLDNVVQIVCQNTFTNYQKVSDNIKDIKIENNEIKNVIDMDLFSVDEDQAEKDLNRFLQNDFEQK
jgi:hypothetical protein